MCGDKLMNIARRNYEDCFSDLVDAITALVQDEDKRVLQFDTKRRKVSTEERLEHA